MTGSLLTKADLILYPLELAHLLEGELAAGELTAGDHPAAAAHMLDAFLLAAALNQVIEDHLERDILSLGPAARRLAGLGSPVANRAAGVVRAGASSIGRARQAWPPVLDLGRRQRAVAGLVDRLADKVVGIALAARPRPGWCPALQVETAGIWETVEEAIGRSWRPQSVLAHSPARPPNCFRVLDQDPEDCLRLVERLLAGCPGGLSPLVVGLRTSGSYLAPLTAAALRAAGQPAVALTMRPGRRLRPAIRKLLLAHRPGGGEIVVVDDPPRSGSALTRALAQLEREGAEPDDLVLLVALTGTEVPEALKGARAVVLPWEGWSVHDRLGQAAAGLVRLLTDRRVDAVDSLTAVEVVDRDQPAGRRHHVAARVAVRLRTAGCPGAMPADFCLEGVGLGYLGRDYIALAQALPGLVPAVLGVEPGLIVREWVPEQHRCTAAVAQEHPDAFAAAVAAYVVARREFLATEADRSLNLRGWGPVWEATAAMLAEAFGRLAPVARIVTPLATRRLLGTAHPTLIDGDMAPTRWFRRPSGPASGLIKLGFSGTAFSNSNLYCYDPIVDLAGFAAAAEQDGVDVGAALVSTYESLTGEKVGCSRWLLYRMLLHQRAAEDIARDLRLGAGGEQAALVARALDVEEAAAGAVRRALAATYLSSNSRVEGSDGPLAALDVDGVLETRWLEVPVPSPAGMLALRALSRHGHRVVLVTGRSLGSVTRRCADYRLAGAVAEYGGGIVGPDGPEVLLSRAQRDDLDALGTCLARIPRLHLDPLHVASRRAFVVEPQCGRRGLTREETAAVLEAVGRPERFKVVRADTQTDFVSAAVDKGSGLAALASRLGSNPGEVGFAMGDTEADRPMLAIAGCAFVPAGADPGLITLARQVRRPAQAGLLEAVVSYLGHDPRRCSTCALPPIQGEDRLLGTMLDAVCGSRRQRLRQGGALLVTLARG